MTVMQYLQTGKSGFVHDAPQVRLHENADSQIRLLVDFCRRCVSHILLFRVRSLNNKKSFRLQCVCVDVGDGFSGNMLREQKIKWRCVTIFSDFCGSLFSNYCTSDLPRLLITRKILFL